MKIILNADDFGYDLDTVKATINCFEKGALTSATIMANLGATKNAIDFAKNNSQYSYGVHLAFVDKILPMAEVEKIKSLLSKENMFVHSNKLRLKSILGLVNKNHIVEEAKKQIGFLLDKGIKISHVDSHGHMHKFLVFQEALIETLDFFCIHKVRKVQDIFLGKPDNKIISILNCYFDRKLKSNFTTTENFYMPASQSDIMWTNNLLQRIKGNQKKEVLEIGIHPGFVEEWRKSEYDEIITFTKLLSKFEHELINWDNL